MKKLLLLFGLVAGGAHAQDEFYSIQPGDAAFQIGNIVATGFFETSGENPNYTGGPEYGLVIGFNLTFKAEGQTDTLCYGVNVGCAPNDAIYFIGGVVANSSGLFCNGCYFTDAGNGPGGPSYFQFDSAANGGNSERLSVSHPDNQANAINASDVINGDFAIASGGPTTYNPLTAPELSLSQGVPAVALLVGVGLVLNGRRRAA
jgi:hypothetical protein